METQLAEKIREKLSALDGFMSKSSETFNDFDIKLTGLDNEVKKAISLAAGVGRYSGGRGGVTETLGALVVKSAEYTAFQKSGGKARIPVNRRLVAKAVIATDTPTGPTTPTQYDGIAGLPMPPLGVMDLLPTTTMNADAVTFNRVKPPHQIAAIQAVQGDRKKEADLQFEEATVSAKTLAIWQPVTNQALRDAPGLQLTIDNELLNALRLLEEQEVLVGDNTAGHLWGLMPEATALAAAPVGETLPDTIAKAIGALAVSGVVANGVVLNPADWIAATMLKTVNGEYLLGDPASPTARALWGVSLAMSVSMPQGSYLVGNFNAASFRYGELASIQVSTENEDYFVRNMSAIKAEEAAALVVRIPAAFVKGTFSAAA